MKSKNAQNKNEVSKKNDNKKILFESVFNTVLEKVNFNLNKNQIPITNNKLAEINFEEEKIEALECKLIENISEDVNQKPISKEVINKIDEKKEKEIQKKLTEYNKQLIREHLLKILTEEKSKEEERERLYKNVNDPIEKKRLEKILAFERAQSSEKINRINDFITEKLNEYEIKLRK